MGNKSSATKIVRKPAPTDIQFRKVTAKNDSYFQKMENDYNFFQYYNLEDLVFQILRFYDKESNEELNKKLEEYNTQQGVKRKNSVNIMTEVFFDKFLESKIIKTVLLGDDYINSDDYTKHTRQFKAFYAQFFNYSNKTYKNFHKAFFGEKLHSHDDFVPKAVLLPLAFYYGNAQMRVKIEVFFNLLCNEEGNISLNDYNFRLLLFSLIAAGSGVSLLSLNDLGKEDEEIRKEFSEEEFIRIYDVYQIKDILRILDDVLMRLFDVKDLAENKELNFEAYKAQFTQQSLYWLFYPSGVRNYLEANPE